MAQGAGLTGRPVRGAGRVGVCAGACRGACVRVGTWARVRGCACVRIVIVDIVTIVVVIIVVIVVQQKKRDDSY